ncbi:MAG: peptide chain release factor N(5)-glutamine methyltransferase, partial [Deltaproteobacteria bacterium]|nr:peptide chain release factor N(5)-glutamine methyltransferase [Deltaproteobacteria bacterium]
MGDETWTVLKVLDWTTGRFERSGLESPRLEAQVLLARVLSSSRVALYTSFDRPMSKGELAAYRELIRRRLAGEPVAYLVGEQEFWSRSFKVDSRVLIPRRDTETLIEAVLDRVGDRQRELEVVDIGTGSGAIAVTLASELPRARVTATDVSAEALEVARTNASAHQLDDRVELIQGDLFEPLGERRFDVIVANLPYVTEGEMAELQTEVTAEPTAALVAGADGLVVIRRLAKELKYHLRKSGLVALEHGYQQGAAVRELLASAGLESVETLTDLGGRDRVTVAAD